MFSIKWTAVLDKTEVIKDADGGGESSTTTDLATYSGQVNFDSLIWCQKAATYIGENLFQQMVESTTPQQPVEDVVEEVKVADTKFRKVTRKKGK